MAKRKSIRLQPQHVEDFKKLKVLTKVINNSKNPKWTGEVAKYTEQLRRQAENQTNRSSTVLMGAFDWKESPEGYIFWRRIFLALSCIELINRLRGKYR